jgi:hypothetical protein
MVFTWDSWWCWAGGPAGFPEASPDIAAGDHLAAREAGRRRLETFGRSGDLDCR